MMILSILDDISFNIHFGIKEPAFGPASFLLRLSIQQFHFRREEMGHPSLRQRDCDPLSEAVQTQEMPLSRGCLYYRPFAALEEVLTIYHSPFLRCLLGGSRNPSPWWMYLQGM